LLSNDNEAYFTNVPEADNDANKVGQRKQNRIKNIIYLFMSRTTKSIILESAEYATLKTESEKA